MSALEVDTTCGALYIGYSSVLVGILTWPGKLVTNDQDQHSFESLPLTLQHA